MRWVLILLLSGCSWYDTPPVAKTKIDYRVYEDLASTREACIKSCNGKKDCEKRMRDALACAEWDLKYKRCTIHIPRGTWEKHTVHEVAHCLLGKIHG